MPESRTFESSRLQLARRRRGMKRSELARRADLTPRTITAYELGERVPTIESLAAIARALAYPEAFFFGPPVENLQQTGISFRALTKMTAPRRDAAIGAGELSLDLIDWMSERFELPPPAVPDLRLEPSPAQAASQLRATWGLSDRPISNLNGLLESKGIRLFSLAERDRTLDGFSFWRGSEPFIFLNTMKSAERSRFDAAHELGHLVLHRHAGVTGMEEERQAMAFAAAFLMPATSIELHAPRPPSLPTLIEAKRWWGVSLVALIRRMFEVQLIGRWYYRELYIQVQKLGFRENEPEPIPRELSRVWPAIFAELRAEGIRRADLAKLLHWPLDELKGLVFQLVLSSEDGSLRDSSPSSPAPARRDALRLIR